MQPVEILKEQGNNAFKAQQYPQALELYSQALQLDPQNYILYSNRSAVFIQLKNYELALSDADMVSRFTPHELNSVLNAITIIIRSMKILFTPRTFGTTPTIRDRPVTKFSPNVDDLEANYEFLVDQAEPYLGQGISSQRSGVVLIRQT